jgi:uncharacterized protein YjbJ (UPF0337 family)
MAGEMDKMKGRAKEAAGALTDDQSLKNEGKADQVGGKVKDVADRAGDKVADAVDRATNDDHRR